MSWLLNRRLAGRVFPVVLAACFLLTGAWTYGGEFRLSFLDSKPVLDDTGTLLQKAGFPEPTVEEFKRLVRHHNRSGHRVDLRQFPAPKDGYYVFSEITDLTSRVTHYFGRTPADSTVDKTLWFAWTWRACFCVARDMQPRGFMKTSTPSRFLRFPPTGKSPPAVRANFSTAVGLLYPAKGYEYLVGRPRSEAETQLGLALRAPRKVRAGATDSGQGLRMIHADLVQQIKADGFRFPTNTQLGLVFYVDVKRGFIKSDHAFICLPQGSRLITVEKTSSTGPFVRAEFGNTDDIALYTSLGEREDTMCQE